MHVFIAAMYICVASVCQTFVDNSGTVFKTERECVQYNQKEAEIVRKGNAHLKPKIVTVCIKIPVEGTDI